jgi:hypothetical protein
MFTVVPGVPTDGSPLIWVARLQVRLPTDRELIRTSYETSEQPLAGDGVVQVACNCVPSDGSDESAKSAVRDGAAYAAMGVSTTKQSKIHFFIVISSANQMTVEGCKGTCGYIYHNLVMCKQYQCCYTEVVCLVSCCLVWAETT